MQLTYCQTHTSKKIKFYCKNDQELFCSKCILKHTSQKHDVVSCSPKIASMQKMIMDLITDVETIEEETPPSEEQYYNKLELKVRKKFNEEIDRLEKSFRRIMEQLDLQQQNLYQMMKEQIDKEIRNLQDKKKKLKERDREIQD